MRRIDWLAATLALVSGAASAQVIGCVVSSGVDDCNTYPDLAKCGGTTSSSTSTSTSTSSTTSSTTVMPGCMGDPLTDSMIVSDMCGVFVSATAMDGGDGTQAKPYKKLSDAIVKAKTAGKFIYACAEAYTEDATLQIKGPARLYGTFTGCEMGGTMWTPDAMKRASLTGPADQVALLLESGMTGSIDITGLDVNAPNAVAAGGSSIAVYVNGGTANLTSCTITAGDGKKGDDGANGPMTPAKGGTNGNSGGAACSADTVSGAPQISTMCSSTDVSVGGKGGDGNLTNGGGGQVGLPANGGGAAGNGDDGSTMTTWTCAGKGGNGGDGIPGATGDNGAAASTFGTLTSAGFVGAPGGDGGTGKPGQGGGGGGGVRGSSTLCTTATKGGASGGSGGSGGCGGEGGKGGKGGGSSIALVSDSANVTLAKVTLNAGIGGDGGVGGNPQSGGAGSDGGKGGLKTVTGLQNGCDGGKGAVGGDGGPGGGGRGGHSIGIASKGTSPTYDANSVTIKTPGNGGNGGLGNLGNNKGQNGEAQKCFDFEKGTSC
jgi:hypothetical protein